MKNRAIFLDRDGIITKLVYDTELGIIHTPLLAKQVELVYGAVEFLKAAKKKGFLLISISNQPNIGIKKTSKKLFQQVKQKIKSELKKNGLALDGEYYCLHHPFADIKLYRKDCECRKPKTLLYEKAINKFNIDPKKSWAVGDGIFDIIAGSRIGAKTILVSNINEAAYFETFMNQLKDDLPKFVVKNMLDATRLILKNPK